MTVQTSKLGKVAVSIISLDMEMESGDVLSTTGPTGERICTVTIKYHLTRALTGMVNWDVVNSACNTVEYLQLDN